MAGVFSWEAQASNVEHFKETVAAWKGRKGALMPILQDAQMTFGYLPRPILEWTAKELNTPIAELYGVATFYSQFSFEPLGKYNISVCQGTACYVKGAEKLQSDFCEALGIEAGATSEDGLFSLVETRCVGECSKAPVVSVNGEMHPHFTKKQIKPLLKKLRSAEVSDD
ncbi:MAG: NAD(P)H-dependent oxidoreductase subunit E [Clostridiaceae bacterium]|jgi:NADH:ubiquinone oxidoreductase subunit E|nr:NAD(P)H-dependent oxidoreductase subunit E [Clostridiaceae bacterium]